MSEALLTSHFRLRANHLRHGQLRFVHPHTVLYSLLLCIMLVAFSGVFPGVFHSAAHATQPATQEVPATLSEAAPPEATTLTLAADAPRYTSATVNAVFTVVLRNDSDTDLSAGRIALFLETNAVQNRSQLTSVLSSTAPRTALVSLDIEATPAHTSQTLSLQVPREALGLTPKQLQSVHRVVAEFSPETAQPQVLSSTTAVILGDTSPKATPVSFLVPLVLPAEITLFPSAAQLNTLAPKYAQLLDAATTARATLAIDPRLIAAIRVLGDSAPTEAQNLLAQLEQSSLPSFLLQLGDADASAQAAIGRSALFADPDLSYLAPPNSSESTASRPPEISPNTDLLRPKNTEPVQGSPTTADLLAWDTDLKLSWPAENTVNAATLQLVQASGYSATVMSSQNVTLRGGPNATLAQYSTLITDDQLSSATKDALHGATVAAQRNADNQLASQLFLAASSGSPGQVIAFDRGAIAEAQDPASLLTQLTAYAWVTPTPIAALPKGTATLVPRSSDPHRVAQLDAAVQRSAAIEQLAPLLTRPNFLSGYQQSRLLTLFASRYAADADSFEATAAAFQRDDETLLQGVTFVSTDEIRLVSTNSQIPVQIRNHLPFEALLSVTAKPASAALDVHKDEFRSVVIPADGSQRVLVPVRARVSSGESGLVLSVVTSAGEVAGEPSTMTIVIRSSVETIGLISIGVLAAALLGFGVWRSVRRKRTASAHEASVAL